MILPLAYIRSSISSTSKEDGETDCILLPCNKWKSESNSGLEISKNIYMSSISFKIASVLTKSFQVLPVLVMFENLYS